MTELHNNLPPGWDSKVDVISGKRYYINHYTKSTTWEDPRMKSKGHGSQFGEYVPLQEMRPNSRTSSSLQNSHTHESSLTIGQDIDELVAKISAMFPTVSDTHIRLLLKKYHNREAVVISALQAEKHPKAISQESSLTIAQDTDESVAKISAMFPTVSDTHIRLLLKKYMKSIFPKAEETVILDVLTSNENNIQKASDCLKSMGYERRDPVKLLQQQEAEAKRAEEEKAKLQERIDKIEIPLVPLVKTAEEKLKIKTRLQEQYTDIMEQVITIALESVQYDETRANQILQIMVQEDNKQVNGNTENQVARDNVNQENEESKQKLSPDTMPVSQSRHSFKSLLITEKAESMCKDKNPAFSRVVHEGTEYKSANLSNTVGANPDCAKGPNEKLLLMDYIPWNGPNTDLRVGPQKSLAKGPNKNNLSDRRYKAFGPNPELRKGAQPGLAKGSMFKQFRNIVIGESRGK